ncbi:hypothetical protein FXO37_36628 [Capsicum annuum]|nr:hypothetical protein FXO37_36628 [Capsicum annuum]
MGVPMDIMCLLHNNPLEEETNRGGEGGGQQVGEIEVWALEGFEIAHILQKMLTYKSDHIRAHQEVLGTTIIRGTIPNLEDIPKSFQLLIREQRSLALDLNISLYPRRTSRLIGRKLNRNE